MVKERIESAITKYDFTIDSVGRVIIINNKELLNL